MDLARFVFGVCARLRVPNADVTLCWTGIRCTCQHVCGRWRAQAETQKLSRSRARLKEGRARTRKGRSWASAAAETWWCFTGQAPTLWPVLVFLPGAANLIWLRPSGWMSWLKLAGVAGCSQCLCWFEAVPPWRSQCLWKTLRGLCTAGCRNQLRVGARGFQDPSPAPPGSDFVDRLWWKRLSLSGVPTSVALRVILLDCLRCSFPFIWRASSSNLGVSQYPKIIWSW
jgi:hypothetical protein